MPNLYPTINLPTLVKPRPVATTQKYYPAPAFNFETGDFIFGGDGRIVMADEKTTFEDWCIKTCSTERGAHLAYSDKIGGEWHKAMKENDADAVKSSIIRTITETIMVNPAAEWVKDFEFEGSGDELKVTFSVKGKYWLDASRLVVSV